MAWIYHMLGLFAFLCGVTVHAIAPTPPGCATSEFDIVFLIDSSKDVSRTEFNESKNFVKNIIEALDVSPMTSRISVVTYGSSTSALNYLENVVMPFGELEEPFGKEELVRVLEYATPVGGTRSIGQALNRVCDEVLGLKSGEIGRRDVPRMVVAFSSGFSRDDISSSLSCGSDDSVTIIGVATNSGGASALTSQHVDLVLQGEADLDRIKEELFEAICSQAVWRNSLAPQDLVFVIDRSQEFSSEDIRHITDWISQISGSFRIGMNFTRVGIVEFGSRTSEIFNPRDNTDTERLHTAIRNITYRSTESHPRNVAEALRYVAQSSFADEDDDHRRNLRKSVVLLTTGPFADFDEAKIAARDLHLGGVEVYVVNIGKSADSKDFLSFSSKPYSTHTFEVVNTAELKKSWKLFVQSLLRGIFKRYSGALLDIHFLAGGISDEMTQFRAKSLMKRISDMFYIGPQYSKVITISSQNGSLIRNSGPAKSDTLKIMDQMFLGDNADIQALLDLEALRQIREGGVDTDGGRERIFIVLTPEINKDPDYWKEIDARRVNGIHTYWYGLSSEGLDWRDGVSSFGTWDGLEEDYRPAADVLVDKISEDGVKGCGLFELDLQFLLDGSSSIKDDNFLQVQDWVQSLVSTFDVGKYTTRVGIDQYSSDAETEFHLDEYDAKTLVLEAVSSMKQKKGLTKIGRAINYTITNSLIPESGARDRVQKIIMVLTDGKSRDEVDKAAAYAHGMKDVTTYAVGVGAADHDQLREIASEPKDRHMFEVENFDQMSAIKNRLGNSMCESARSGKLPENRGDQLDLIVLFEDSTLIPSSKYFLYIEGFIMDLAMSAVAQYDSRFALVNFAAKPRTIMPFTVNISSLVYALRNSDQPNSYYSSVNLDLALSHVQDMFFETPGRDHAQKVLVTIMSNPTKEKSFHNAQLLTDKGVHVFGISLGRTASLTHLEKLVSSTDYFFALPDATSLVKIEPVIGRKIREVSKAVCKNMEMSLVLVVDDSSAITKANFDVILEFLSNIVSGLTIDEFYTHVSMMLLEPGRYAYRMLNLQEGTATEAILTLPMQSTLVDASNAIRVIGDIGFEDVTDDRKNVPKMVIAVTHGVETLESEVVSNAGATLMEIKVGESDDPPFGEYLLNVNSIRMLPDMSSEVISMLCKAASCPVLYPKRDSRKGFDVIDAMELAHSSEMKVIPQEGMGDNSVAYQFQGRSRVFSSKSEVFPNGFPTQNFMLVTTLRMGKRASRSDAWQVIELTAPGGDTEFSISIDSNEREIGVLGDSNPPEIATFRGDVVSSFFDRDWHKLQFVFTGDEVELHIDCKIAGSLPFMSSRLTLSRDGVARIGKLIRSRKSSAFVLERLEVFCGLEGQAKDNLEECCEVEGIDLPQCRPSTSAATTTTPSTSTSASTTTSTAASTAASTTASTTTSTTTTTQNSAEGGGRDTEVILLPKCDCPAGPPGPVGQHGTEGIKGEPGLPGEDGILGANGPRGPKGSNGDRGSPGPPGESLRPEPNIGEGTVGPVGLTGPPGPPGPRGSPGIPGGGNGSPSGVRNQKAFAWETTDARITQIAQAECRNLLNSEVPRMVAALIEHERFRERYRGPKGDVGPQGNPGYSGESGLQGIAGPRGPPGLRGLTGPEGQTGPLGPKGDIGERGETGFGVPGLDGRLGRRGSPGKAIHGESGQKGALGPQGERGPPGHEGRRGPYGINGRCEPDSCYAAALRLISDSRESEGGYNNAIKG